MRQYRNILFCALCVFLLSVEMHSQGLVSYRVNSPNDIFTRESQKVLTMSATLDGLPVLSCSIEYIRRDQGNDIVYRRGPHSMEQHGQKGIAGSNVGARPTSESDMIEQPSFTGGLLVDLPRVGETNEYVANPDERYRYMVRATIVPTEYRGKEMTARVVLERAVVLVGEGMLDIAQSEVFSRDITLVGNEPLQFTLPSWDLPQEAYGNAVPPSLEEALLITLETPRALAFAKNEPEPFSLVTRLSYAVPDRTTIKLSIVAGEREYLLEEGVRDAGLYSLTWNAGTVPDGSYSAKLSSVDEDHATVQERTLSLTKDRNAATYSPLHASTSRFGGDRFLLSTESGFAFQLPRDSKKPLRHMFTHVALRLGYVVNRWLEAGLVAGQDAFNEKPGPRVDIDRISNYGGVVPYTYGYLGPYARLSISGSVVRPMAQVSVAWSDAGTISELALGARVTLFSKLDLFLLPHVTAHVRNPLSAKIGLNYGMAVRF